MSVYASNVDMLRFKVDATILFRLLDEGDSSSEEFRSRYDELVRLYDTKSRWLLEQGCGEELWGRWLELVDKGVSLV